MADETPNPSTPSSDYQAMQPYWRMVDAILGGADAMRAPGPVGQQQQTYSQPGPTAPVAQLGQLKRGFNFIGESPYLPRYPNEFPADYENRRINAPFTNIYSDISSNLASKPFSKELALADDTADDLKTLAENIDGQGNNLHVFAKATFKSAIDRAIDWILIDYTKVPAGATLADERSMGARPYWVHIPPERLLAVYSDFVNGQEVIYHARVHEPVKELAGYGETCIDRVRVFQRQPIVELITDAEDNVVGQRTTGYGPATWELYEAQEAKDANGQDSVNWVLVDQGPITIGIIPLVSLCLGYRCAGWKLDAPLRDIAYMQVEEFQQESGLKYAKDMTCFPMLAIIGVAQQDADGKEITVPVGPKGVIIIPPSNDGSGRSGDAKYIEPGAQSLNFLKSDLEALRTEMRNLGMQPLATANLTVVTTANVAMKAHNAVQAWAYLLKDALEQAWKITCMWLKRTDEPEVNVHTDFAVDLQAQTELDALQKAQAAGTISQELHFSELKRRGVLSDDADWDEDQERVATERQGLQPEQPIDPRTGQPIVMQPQPNGAALQ